MQRADHRAVAKVRRSPLFTLSKQRKISATFLEFVEPLLPMATAPPSERLRELLTIAVLVWNAVILDDQRGADYLSEVRAKLEHLEDPGGRELTIALVDNLVDRKRNHFADDHRLIGDWKIDRRSKGEFRLRVETRARPQKK